MDVGTSGLKIDMIKNLLKSTVERFIQVIVSTALVLGGVILLAADLGPQLAPEHKLFTYFGARARLAGSARSALDLVPAFRHRIAWNSSEDSQSQLDHLGPHTLSPHNFHAVTKASWLLNRKIGTIAKFNSRSENNLNTMAEPTGFDEI